MSLLFFVKINKGNLILNGFGNPWRRRSHSHTTLAACITSRKKEGKNVTFFWCKEGINHTGEFYLLLFRKRKKIPPCPSSNTLTNACSQGETATTLNSRSSPMNFCSKQPSPISSSNLIRVSPSPLFYIFACDSLQPACPECNSLLFTNKPILLVKSNWLFYFWGSHLHWAHLRLCRRQVLLLVLQFKNKGLLDFIFKWPRDA